MKKLLIVTLIALISLTCKNKTSEAVQAAGTTDQSPAASVTAKGRYGIKSGIVVYKVGMMGMSGTQTNYWDNYGSTEANFIIIDMMGTKSETITLTKDGTVYNYDPIRKTGSKTPAMTGMNVNFEDLSDEVVREWNLKKEGKENILGRDCDKYSLDNQQFGIKGYYWVWKGVPLKVDADMSNVKMTMIATSFEENATIPADKIAVPADIVFNQAGNL